MTVPSRDSAAMQVYKYEYVSNPERLYEIGFKFLGLDENVSAFLRMADSSVIPLKEGTHYAITTTGGNNNIWGTFQFKRNADLPTDVSLVNYLCIYRKISNDQSNRFDSQTIFASTTEEALDKLTMLIQDYMVDSKYIRVPVDTNLSGVELDLELPPINQWTDGSILGFKQKGNVYKLTIFSESAIDMRRALRQPIGETEDPSFEISLEERKDKILGFNEFGSVRCVDPGELGIQSDWNQSDGKKADYIKNKPTIPAAQVNSDWNAASGVAQILNKPTIPTGQVNSDWNAASGVAQILNKPGNASASVSGLMSSGDKGKLDNIAAGAEVNVQSDWNITDSSLDSYIKNKPTIPTGQVNSDWNASSGVAQILNKPTLSPVATSGSYNDLNNKLTAGPGITIDNNRISAEAVEYRAGENITISGDNIISCDVLATQVPDPSWWLNSTEVVEKKWSSIAYGNGVFVAVAQGSRDAAYSFDGIYWLKSNIREDYTWSAITFGYGVFVAVNSDNHRAAFSSNGIDWRLTEPSSGTGLCAITRGLDKFVAVPSSGNKSMYSPDGINWTESTLPFDGYWYSIAYGNGMFVSPSSGYSSKVIRSSGGVTWQEGTMPSAGYWTAISFGKGKFVSLNYDTNKSAHSSNGVNWTESTMPASTKWQSMTYGCGKFVAISGFGQVAYSSDGINWTSSSLSIGGGTSVAYGGGLFVAVGYEQKYASYCGKANLEDLL